MWSYSTGHCLPVRIGSKEIYSGSSRSAEWPERFSPGPTSCTASRYNLSTPNLVPVADSILVDSLLNPCKCSDILNCKCQVPSDALRPVVRDPGNSLDTLAVAAAICCNEVDEDASADVVSSMSIRGVSCWIHVIIFVRSGAPVTPHRDFVETTLCALCCTQLSHYTPSQRNCISGWLWLYMWTTLRLSWMHRTSWNGACLTRSQGLR